MAPTTNAGSDASPTRASARNDHVPDPRPGSPGYEYFVVGIMDRVGNLIESGIRLAHAEVAPVESMPYAGTEPHRRVCDRVARCCGWRRPGWVLVWNPAKLCASCRRDLAGLRRLMGLKTAS